jgi:PAS domain S-box-containing protein
MPLKNSSKNGKRPLLWQQVLIVAITLTAVTVVILLGRQIYRETREMATEQFNQQQLILARAAAAGIEAYYKELSNALSSLANLPNIQHMASESLTCIQHTYWGFPPRTSIRLLDSDGILRFIYPLDGWRGELIGRDYGEEAYFQEARETGHTSVSGLIVNEQGETRIRIAVPVYLTYKTETVRLGDESGVIATPIDPDEPEAGRFQGVLVSSLDPHIIAQDFTSPIVSGKTGYAWLLNEEGIFIAHHEEGFTGRNGFEVRAERNPDISYEAIEQIQHRMIAGEEGVGRYVSGWHRGQKGETEKLIAYTPVHINDNTWSVAVCAPVSEAEEVIQMTKRTEQYTLAFVILALAAGGLCLFTTSYRWSRSLEQEVGRRMRELGETSDYLSNLIRYANAPIIVWNPDRQVTIFNEAFEKMSGRTEAEMTGQPLDVLFPKESRSDALHKIESASKGEYWETVEIPILRQDGEIRLGLWNSANIYGEDGKTLIATVAQGQNITERKRAEEALRASESEKKSILNAISDVVVFQDRSLSIRWANEAAARSVDRTPQELVGCHCYEVWHGRSEPCEGCPILRTLETGSSASSTMRTPDGRWWEIVGETVRDYAGKTVGAIEIARDITERKRAEEVVRETTQLLETILDHTHMLVAYMDPQFNFVRVNRVYAEADKREPSFFPGKNHFDLYPNAENEAIFRRVVETGKPHFVGAKPFEYAEHPGRGVSYWDWSLVPIKNPEGTVTGLVLTLVNVTERVRAEEALRESELRYRTTIDAMGDAIHLVGPDLRFTLVNPAHRQWAKELGSGTPDYIGHTIFEVFPSLPDRLRDKLRDEYDRVFRTGETLITEESTMFGDRELVTETRKIPIFEKGRVTQVVTVMRDITERKRAEEALRESEAQKQALLDASPDMIMQIDTNMKILWANRTALDMNLDAVGQTCHKAFPGMNEPCEGCPCKKAINTGQIEMGVQYQPAVVGVQGESYWEDIGVPLKDSDGKVVGVIEIARNVTERVLAEEALRRSLERTSRGQRLLLALSQAAQAVQRARTPDEVYQTVGGEVARLDYQVAIFTLTDDRAHLTVRHLTVGPAVLRAARRLTGLPAQDYRFPLVPGGFFERIIAAGETIFVERTTESIAEALPGPVRPLADRLVTMLGLERAICAPLTVGGERHGLLSVVGADLAEADVPAITAFATQAATAIENAWLFEEVRAGREQLRDLTSYLQTAREEERAYIAREIHDEFGQSLTALKMDLAWLTKRLADRPRLAEKASTMSDLIDSTIQTVRRVATQLRPGLLDDLGLAAAIEWQAQELAERTGINCELYLGDEDIVLDRDLATAVFRIFQEMLTNVARHAEATEVQVELEEGPDKLVLIVRDNGKGITPGQISDPHSLGLIGMRERARSWGGDVIFQSVPGQGTVITVRVPRPD